ncbi:MAG: heat-inducible transcription repressor HrcA [Solobacterium sp.]|nr:heat-inducible transcription repressor HrcA [Solobacterium sp.]
MLTPRRIEIFKAIVDEYIRTAEPVGSKTLQKKYKLPYSSATIRNDMQVLEEMGYLEKTHTSSGRIPSTQGYRFYCENLLSSSGLDKKMEVAIQDAFNLSNMSMEEAVHQSCAILSEMTNMTTGAIGPDAANQRLEHIKLFPLDDRNTVCVFITNTGHTETGNFHFDEAVSLKDIESCTEILNSRLKGVRITELADRMDDLKPVLAAEVERHDILFTAFVKAFVKFASENVYFSGKDRMLYQPEFENIDKLKSLMNLLEDPSVWRGISSSENAVAVRTARGAELTWLDDVAVVRSSFQVNDHESGQLMVVGPSRMNYDKVVSMIEYAAQMIEKMYLRGGDGNKHEQ